MIWCLFLSFAGMLLIGVPVSVCLVLAATAAMAGFSHFGLEVVVSKLYSASENFPLVAIPFFILAGNIMSKGGMSDRLIRLAQSVVGRVRGGLAMVMVMACMFFASVSGSTAATTAAIGIVLIPAIVRQGFSRGSATSLQATAGSIGIIIPPSLPFVLLGVISGISIGELFLGGVFPGLILGAVLMVVAYLTARVQKHPPSGESFSVRRVGQALWHSVLSLLTVVWIIGGIIGGYVTPTEAAIVAVVWSALVSGLVYRELRWGHLPEILVNTVKITAVVVLCIGASAPFAWLMTIEHIPDRIASAMLAVSGNAYVLRLLMVLILLGVGTFLDLTPAMILLVPILMPVAASAGMAPVHFGVMTVMALGVGQCTPPVGIALFVACGVSKTRVGEVLGPLVPYLAAMVVALLLVTFWGPFSTWLPAVLI
ncbi:MAG: TRAP transporter large permease [Sedimentisphaerales bacterium]|nr:TRAP transporter large permease [Sedimentisphaerales bacterium]